MQVSRCLMISIPPTFADKLVAEVGGTDLYGAYSLT